jgi:hypothetical protein
MRESNSPPGMSSGKPGYAFIDETRELNGGGGLTFLHQEDAWGQDELVIVAV